MTATLNKKAYGVNVKGKRLCGQFHLFYRGGNLTANFLFVLEPEKVNKASMTAFRQYSRQGTRAQQHFLLVTQLGRTVKNT
jgi:hypothetical protein